jgi:malate/lactate dehydrogenase
MRRKVTCTARTPAGQAAALLLAQLDLTELVVLDGPEGLAADLAGAAGPLGYEPRVTAGAWADAAGSDLVVVDAAAAPTAAEIAARCAGAVVVAATADPVADTALLLEGTRLPRARVFGPAGAEGAPAAGPVTTAALALQAVDAILRDRRATLRCAVLCLPEDGAEGVHPRDVVIGAGGVQAIL